MSLQLCSFSLDKGCNMRIKNLAKSYVGIYKADQVGQDGEQRSTCYSCTLQSPRT